MSHTDPLRASIQIVDHRSDPDPMPGMEERVSRSLGRLLENPVFREHAERTINAYGSLRIVLLNSGMSSDSAYNNVFIDERSLATALYQSEGGGFTNTTLEQTLHHETGHTGDPRNIALRRDALISGWNYLIDRYPNRVPEQQRQLTTDDEKARAAADLFFHDPVDSLEGRALRDGIAARNQILRPNIAYPRGDREAYAIGVENLLLQAAGTPLRDPARYSQRPEDLGISVTPTPEIDALTLPADRDRHPGHSR